MSEKFDISQMLADMDGGSLLEQLAYAVHEAAKAAVLHGDGAKKSKVALTLDIAGVKNAQQVVIAHKLEFKTLTPRGSVTEVTGNECPFHVSSRGVSLMPDNQRDLFKQESDNG